MTDDTLLVMLTIQEASQKFSGVKPSRIRQWIITGEIPSIKCGKKYLICEQVLKSFLLNGNNTLKQTEPQKIRRLL